VRWISKSRTFKKNSYSGGKRETEQKGMWSSTTSRGKLPDSTTPVSTDFCADQGGEKGTVLNAREFLVQKFTLGQDKGGRLEKIDPYPAKNPGGEVHWESLEQGHGGYETERPPPMNLRLGDRVNRAIRETRELQGKRKKMTTRTSRAKRTNSSRKN